MFICCSTVCSFVARSFVVHSSIFSSLLADLLLICFSFAAHLLLHVYPSTATAESPREDLATASVRCGSVRTQVVICTRACIHSYMCTYVYVSKQKLRRAQPVNKKKDDRLFVSGPKEGRGASTYFHVRLFKQEDRGALDFPSGFPIWIPHFRTYQFYAPFAQKIKEPHLASPRENLHFGI